MPNDHELKLLQANGLLDRFRNTTHRLDAMVRSLTLARDAKGLPRLLALMSVAGNVLDILMPERDTVEVLGDLGWTTVAQHAGVLRLLREHMTAITKPERVRVPGSYPGEEGTEVLVWHGPQRPVAALVKQHGHDQLLENRPGAFAELLGRLWTEHPGLAVEAQNTLAGVERLSLVPLRAVTAPVGPAAEELREWLRSPAEGTRVVLIVGPTGAGKTTMARTAIPNGRVLQIAASMGHQAALELTALLCPEVVLLDDLVLGDGLDAGFAALLDRLHGHVPLVVATLMDDTLTAASAHKPGALYWPGMRAGRLDRVVFIAPPDADGRRAILAHHGLFDDEAVRLSAGLTGAFLEELARRRLREPSRALAEVVTELRAQAPASFSAGLSGEAGPS
ncbi:MAG: hypothetical protein GY913_34500 [Proteobacteria bacterium]|nr:hypothetical protein [Pseudomonadota bacterium]MCP4922041.1 hypothetical protein [Pseudomonadota bacterium]